MVAESLRSSSKVEHSHRHGQYLNSTLSGGVRKGILLMSERGVHNMLAYKAI